MSFEDNLPPRVLAIDPGEKRVGLAVSDPFGNFAIGLETIANHPGKDLMPEIKAVCQQYDVQKIVIEHTFVFFGTAFFLPATVARVAGTLVPFALVTFCWNHG